MKKYNESSILPVLMCGLLLSALAWARQAEGKRGITPEDYFAFEFCQRPPDLAGRQTGRLCGQYRRSKTESAPLVYLDDCR